MKKRSVGPFPQAATGCLAFLLIAILLLTQAGASYATPASPAAMKPHAPQQLVWVREDEPVINVNNDPLRYESTDPRFAGSFTQYTVTETTIAMEERYVDHGYEWYHVTLTTDLQRPPLVLNPPLRYKVSASFSHSGTNNNSGGVGAQFWYASDDIYIEPRAVLPYYPWHPDFEGTNSKDWMISAPAAYAAGNTFQMYAGWWNCAPCNITWTYRAEPANAVEQLGVEVVAPVVTYQGEAVPPGEVFFPETCAASRSRDTAAKCQATITLAGYAETNYACYAGAVNRVLLILNRSEIGQLKQELVLHVALAKIAEACRYNARAADQPALGLSLQQGAMSLSNVVSGQTISVETPLGMAVAAKQGAFLTGYNPETGTAIFRAYSGPLTLQPQAGAGMVLQPPGQVELTAAGFGPVTALPHAFLPVLIR